MGTGVEDLGRCINDGNSTEVEGHCMDGSEEGMVIRGTGVLQTGGDKKFADDKAKTR